MKNWEIIADNLSKAGWSYGYVSALVLSGRTIWIADAHRDDGQHGFRRTRVPESAEPLEEGLSAAATLSH